MKQVEVKSEKRLLNDFLKVDEAQISFEKFDGAMSPTVRRLVLERGDSVAALVYHEEWKEYILVNQFRYPTHKKGPGWISEVVAGALEENENPMDSIKRELEEEIGYTPSILQHISTFYVSPGGTSERIFLYYATINEASKVGEGGGLAEENEDILMEKYTKEDLVESITHGEIQDAKTIIAIMWLQNR